MPLPPPLPPLPPPHPIAPPVREASKTSRPSIVRSLRRRAGIPKNRRQANTAPPEIARTLGRSGAVRAPVVGAVLEMVRVAVTAEAPVIFTGFVEPKLNPGRSCAPVGLEVIAALSDTLPVKPPLGVTVMVAVFPEVAPGAIDTVRLLMAKLGGGFTTTLCVTCGAAV